MEDLLLFYAVAKRRQTVADTECSHPPLKEHFLERRRLSLACLDKPLYSFYDNAGSLVR
jgi:hypothetical protein